MMFLQCLLASVSPKQQRDALKCKPGKCCVHADFTCLCNTSVSCSHLDEVLKTSGFVFMVFFTIQRRYNLPAIRTTAAPRCQQNNGADYSRLAPCYWWSTSWVSTLSDWRQEVSTRPAAVCSVSAVADCW